MSLGWFLQFSWKRDKTCVCINSHDLYFSGLQLRSQAIPSTFKHSWDFAILRTSLCWRSSSKPPQQSSFPHRPLRVGPTTLPTLEGCSASASVSASWRSWSSHGLEWSWPGKSRKSWPIREVASPTMPLKSLLGESNREPGTIRSIRVVTSYQSPVGWTAKQCTFVIHNYRILIFT